MNFDVNARAEGLLKQFNQEISHERLRAVGDYWIAFILMLVIVSASIIAGLGGLAFDWTAKSTAIVAFIPGAISLVATTLKFHGKSDWHYRRLYALESLRSRLQYELSNSVTTDQIAAISKAHRQLIARMNEEWEERLGFDFNQFKPSKRQVTRAESEALDVHLK